MITRKDLIIAVLATFCLSFSLFTIVPTRSQTSFQYDPWEDINEDGVIDIADIVHLTNSYRATGNPTKNVTVTNWPTSLNITIVPYTLSVTLAENKTTSGTDVYSQGLSTHHKYLTLGMACTSGTAWFEVYWIVGGVEAYLTRFRIFQTDEYQNMVSQKFSVQGEAVRIRVRPDNGICTYSLGLYASN